MRGAAARGPSFREDQSSLHLALVCRCWGMKQLTVVGFVINSDMRSLQQLAAIGGMWLAHFPTFIQPIAHIRRVPTRTSSCEDIGRNLVVHVVFLFVY
jgi:hypothetical protein